MICAAKFLGGYHFSYMTVYSTEYSRNIFIKIFLIKIFLLKYTLQFLHFKSFCLHTQNKTKQKTVKEMSAEKTLDNSLLRGTKIMI